MPGLPYEHFCPYEEKWSVRLRQYPEFESRREEGVCWLGATGMAVHALMQSDGYTLGDVISLISFKMFRTPTSSEEWYEWANERWATSYKAKGSADLLRDFEYPNCRGIDAVLRTREFPLLFQVCSIKNGSPDETMRAYEKMLQDGYVLMPTMSVWPHGRPTNYSGHVVYLGSVDTSTKTVVISDPNDTDPAILDLDEYRHRLAEPFPYSEDRMGKFDEVVWLLRRLRTEEIPSATVT